MMAFDHVYLDVARRDGRAMKATSRAGTAATFAFREFYCTEPGCDCRRVLLHVHWVEEKRVAASIDYAFDRSRRRDEPQISLDPLSPQSEIAENVLALFSDMIASDREYRELLIRHYTMWKQVVDDPTHPEHAKVRGKAHEDPSFQPAFRRRKARPAKRRAAAAGGPAGSRSLELVAAKGAHADSKLQQRFRRLLEKVDHLKQRVGAWRTARPDIDTEISLHAALVERLGRLGRDMVVLLEHSYASPGLTRADRKKLGHDDLKPLYNRYSRSDFDAEVAAGDAETAEALRSMMEVMGMEFGDADVGSLDKLQEFTEARQRALEQEAAAAEERSARRKKSAKQVAAEARREDDRKRTGKALQDVYRALAMALHPDREQDPVERARKTEVMREVNVAYEAKDLLRLLELQLELERVEPARADAIAEDRLRHYTRILDDQAKQLAIELDELELPFRMELGLAPTARLAPADVIARIRADAQAVKEQIAALTHDLEALADVTRLKAWLKTQAGPRARDIERELQRSLFG